MTEIDVSLILKQDCSRLSASAAELGPDAGAITWRNCLAFAKLYPLITDQNRDDARNHFASYGAWERGEIDAWDDVTLSAMIWQEAAADTRHFEEHCDDDLERYEADCEKGRVSGRLYIYDTPNGRRATTYLGP